MPDGPRYEDGFYASTQCPAKVLRFDWMETIVDARQTLFDKLTPPLRRDVKAVLEKLYSDARQRAALGLRRYGAVGAAERLPATSLYSWDEICQQDWYPVSPASEAK